MDEKNLSARRVFQTVCSALDHRQWTYEKREEDLVIMFGVKGEEDPVEYIILVDADRQIIRLLSPICFKMCEEKRIDGAIATVGANYGLVDGAFDYDIADGSIIFRMAASFRDSQIGEELVSYMIAVAGAMVNQYGVKFMAIDKGVLSVADFLREE